MAIAFGITRGAARRALGIALAGALVCALARPTGVRSQEAAQILRVPLDKSATLRLDRAASIVTVGPPEVADVTVAAPTLVFVLGRKVGETDLVILDAKGATLAAYDIVVVPEAGRHVTIYKSTDGVLTLSCDPRCAGVKNPGTEKEPGSSSSSTSTGTGTTSTTGSTGSSGTAAAATALTGSTASGTSQAAGAGTTPSQSYSTGQ